MRFPLGHRIVHAYYIVLLFLLPCASASRVSLAGDKDSDENLLIPGVPESARRPGHHPAHVGGYPAQEGPVPYPGDQTPAVKIPQAMVPLEPLDVAPQGGEEHSEEDSEEDNDSFSESQDADSLPQGGEKDSKAYFEEADREMFRSLLRNSKKLASAKKDNRWVRGEASLGKKCLSEFVGTGILIHLGCGVVCSSRFGCLKPKFGLPHNAMIWGIAVAISVYLTRDISGAHLNPAITASMAVNKPEEFPKEHVLPYWAAQMLGATAAGAINYLLFGGAIAAYELKHGIVRGTAASTASFNGAFGLVPNLKLISTMGAFCAEIWMTGVLVFLAFAITDPDNTIPSDLAAPVLLGALVATLGSVFAPLTGCGMNPVRDLGPRIVTFFAGWGTVAFSYWWLYSLGPMLGAVAGGALYQRIFAQKA